MSCTDRTVTVGSFPLHHGGCLSPCTIAYQALGDPRRPAVLVLGGISAGREVAGPGGLGWWSDFVGRGRAIDPDRFCVIGMDYLGGCGASTGPALDQSIDTGDQARAVAGVLESLGIPRLHRIVGSSYGGMVALRFAALFPESVHGLVVISAAHRSHPMATALRCAQRNVVRLNADSPHQAASLAIARGIAMTTYRSEREFNTRFATTPYRNGTRFRFPVEDYLDHVGTAYACRVTPETFVPLSESIDLHVVDPGAVTTPTTLVSVDEDRLVPPWLMAELRDGLAGPRELVTISSVFGHDAFLKEVDAMSSILDVHLGEHHA